MSLKLRHMEMATLAMDIVEALSQKNRSKKSERVEILRKVPSHIQTSGLGQTIAWLLKKDTDIANSLCQGLVKLSPFPHGQKDSTSSRPSQRPGASTGPGEKFFGEKFLKLLVTGDAATYRQQSRQALAFTEWLKRFADVEKKKEK